jgi:hypothetical protein
MTDRQALGQLTAVSFRPAGDVTTVPVNDAREFHFKGFKGFNRFKRFRRFVGS